MSIDKLARPEIRALRPYVTAEQLDSTVRLNANEAPYLPGQTTNRQGLNRYPEIHARTLRTQLAGLYSVPEVNLLPTRGSTEAIDSLFRTFCRPHQDNVVITPPTFSMYRVYADIQGAEVVTVPLRAEDDFTLDRDAIQAASTNRTKLIFVCSPNNPTGGLVPRRDIIALAEAATERSLIVVDEAYIEFSAGDSVAAQIREHENIVVLRTLSKAWGLAGARCGAVIACRTIIGLLERILPPYSFSSPATDCVLECLTSERIGSARALVGQTIAERERLRERLCGVPCVRYVWPSESNFLLVRFDDLTAVHDRLGRARILIREFADDPVMVNCARITVGSRPENDLLLSAIDVARETRQCL